MFAVPQKVMKIGTIIDIIEKETSGTSFKSHRYCNDDISLSNIEYDDLNNVEWLSIGETVEHKEPICLKQRARSLSDKKSIFTYFLDGSRHTYKVDDISYNKNIYPILAGQIGIGCTKRVNKEILPELFIRKLVIVLPDIAYRDGWGADSFFNELKNQINNDNELKSKFGISFDAILTYSRDKDDKLEKKGTTKIQDFMIEQEKLAVAKLVAKGRLDQNNFLIKDGSLEYKVVKDNSRNLNNKRVANYYTYVIGVSKSFDPTKCLIKGGGTNSDIIANLKVFERTPVYMYQSKIAGDVCFAIWYLRIRDCKYCNNVFDGVLKVEKLIIGYDENYEKLDSELVDHISAHLINERNPVCYGDDSRWANHLYPIYLTESYIKSKYLSNTLFMHVF